MSFMKSMVDILHVETMQVFFRVSTILPDCLEKLC